MSWTARSMTPVQQLAREICWAGFTTKAGRAGKTKNRYWQSISDHARADYIEEAERFAFLLKRVDVDVLNKL